MGRETIGSITKQVSEEEDSKREFANIHIAQLASKS